MAELIRVLRPGRTIAVLNIPLWSVRHFQFLQQVAGFQNWIAWDALSYPVRKIMPAHYSILCFTKDKPRPIPGLINGSQLPDRWAMPSIPDPLLPMAEGFCLRETCIQQRRQQKVNDRGILTDLWWDIHRLKHNTRRVDHPCQLPPQLLYRLIALFTEPGEVVLDCFNGAGTTTLAAHQLGRRYLGIDISEEYIELARSRHVELQNGIDPFRKADRALTAKNSPVPRMPKRRYEIPKKTLQLEVKRIAEALGHLPTREEVIQYGRYPIRYYDEYFVSWGEVCAAARTTGMTEDRGNRNSLTQMHQLRLFDTSE
jgi:site-specific DNA-methyltransferase (adenine-specific)